jgi:hypothetical protein
VKYLALIICDSFHLFRLNDCLVTAAHATGSEYEIDCVPDVAIGRIGSAEPVGNRAQKLTPIVRRQQSSSLLSESGGMVSMSSYKYQQYEREDGDTGNDEASKDQTDRGAVGHI